MLVYKIAHKNYAHTLTASGISGRWASSGKMVIYAAESTPLAFLENMVRRQGVGFNDDFKTVIIEIPDDLEVEFISVKDLTVGWRNFKIYTFCQQLGDRWYNAMKKPVLKVPSAILLEYSNYVINTLHAGFSKIKIATFIAFLNKANIWIAFSIPRHLQNKG